MARVTIFFNRRPIDAHASDTVASALYRSGVRIFSRSFKYHRPRGLLCCAGRCPNCLMNVDGVPNVRTCITPVANGMQVRHQNAHPSLEHDVLSLAGSFGWLMPVGFYYKTFTHRWAWKLARPLIRKVAGLGQVERSVSGVQRREYEHLHLHCDLAVIGGGEAGGTAAIQAAQDGAGVVLLESEPEVGGWWRYQAGSTENVDRLNRMRETLARCGNLQVFTGAHCFGVYEGNLLGAIQILPPDFAGEVVHDLPAERLIHLRAPRLIVATGAYEVPAVFENSDLPGVMLSSAVQRLVHLHGTRPADSAVIVTSEMRDGQNRPRSEQVAHDLNQAGVRVEGIVSLDQVVAATGRKHVTGIRTRERFIPCGLIVVIGTRVPEVGLLAQAGGRLEWDPRGAFVATGLPAHVTAVGEDTGAEGQPVPAVIPGKRSFVCLCEDVTVPDLYAAIAEGFDHIEMLKRYTTVTMGPCQGKMCQLASIGICAQATGRTPGATGTTTARPPTIPVSLGALAGARHHAVKRTPLHYKHEGLGAVWMDMGEWKRPLYYAGGQIAESGSVGGRRSNAQSAVAAECRAVRERVGIIDVSTLGKLDLKGKDAPALLDKIYTNRIGDLRNGRVRYSLICDDTGIILDDGTVSRLADDHFFLTTTTGNVDFVQQWLEWWTAGTGRCVHITNLTAGLAAINVAGPCARDVLARVTDCDLSAQAFPYMACASAEVAAVPCWLLRIGFVGETGWEIHFPAEYAEPLWDAILEAGRQYHIRPFGVEAQRLLRLEKKHVIVGVDTDATSNPLAADLAWVAKMDKEDFIGKAALLRLGRSQPPERLVGFVMEDGKAPEDGAAVVVDGSPVGRVTSARLSPSLGKAVGLVWLPARLALEGQDIAIHIAGRLEKAHVTLSAFYDPKGGRLRA